MRTLTREAEPQLWRAFMGSLGLLGIIASAALQLQRVASPSVDVRRRAGRCLAEVLALLAEEEAHSDFMEAWLDGFASGPDLGRGIVRALR